MYYFVDICKTDVQVLLGTGLGMRMLELVIGDDVIPVTANHPISIGRSTHSDVQLSDPHVSRTHAELRPGPDGWELIDLSTGGTWLGTQRVDRITIDRPVVLRLGSRGAPEVTFRLTPPPPAFALADATFLPPPPPHQIPATTASASSRRRGPLLAVGALAILVAGAALASAPEGGDVQTIAPSSPETNDSATAEDELPIQPLAQQVETTETTAAPTTAAPTTAAPTTAAPTTRRPTTVAPTTRPPTTAPPTTAAPTTRAPATTVAPPTTTTAPPRNCQGYDPCIEPGPDVDCRGGSGDGPRYSGPVRVTGSDPYGLDRDNDGWGCESS